MIRGEAEISSKPFNYTVGATTGSAQMLATPPNFESAP
jgi:hypothetical protein